MQRRLHALVGAGGKCQFTALGDYGYLALSSDGRQRLVDHVDALSSQFHTR